MRTATGAAGGVRLRDEREHSAHEGEPHAEEQAESQGHAAGDVVKKREQPKVLVVENRLALIGAHQSQRCMELHTFASPSGNVSREFGV